MPSRKEDEGVCSFSKLLRLEKFNQVKSPAIRSNPSNNRNWKQHRLASKRSNLP